jgi:hypothetical protein
MGGGVANELSGGADVSFATSLASVVTVFSEMTLGFFGGGGATSPSSLAK